MPVQAEKRKLAAVMFADIEGYTTLFQRNEGAAFKLLEQHRTDLEQITTGNNGQVIKYYGDGSLTLFNSVIEAIRSAIELQKLSANAKVPLRIGIHMGEMIEKHNDVYGDAVNVASRIQALGISGSILVSKTVIDELKNHPTIHSKSLGIVHLKNVKTPVEVFAILDKDLAVPFSIPEVSRKKRNRLLWVMGSILLLVILGILYKDDLKSRYAKLGEECIIIPAFIPFGSNPKLDTIGDMAASIMSKVMSESAKVEIIDYRSALAYTNVNLASINDDPGIARRWGAKYMIQGHLTLEGKAKDSIRIWMRIIDLYNDNKELDIFIPEVKCKLDNPMDGIQRVCNIMAGYWKSKKDYLFHFTNDSAYLAFNAAQKKWVDPEFKNETKEYLLKAIAYDSKFLDAWFLLLDFFHNEEDFQNGMDTLSVVEKIFPDLDERQQNYLNHYKYDFDGKNVQAYTAVVKELKQNKRDLFTSNTAMVMAKEYLNDPAAVIRIFNQLDNDEMDLSTCSYCITRLNIAMLAYLDLPDLKKAGELVSRLRPYARKTQHFIDLIEYYVKVSDTTAINDAIRAAVNLPGRDTTDEEPYLCLITAQIAAINGEKTLTQQYAQRAIHYPGKNYPSNIGRAQMIIGNLEEAKKIFLGLIAEDPGQRNIQAFLGVIYARQGDRENANRIIQKLTELQPKKYDFGMTEYRQGRIKANLGETEEALNYFRIALDEGLRFITALTFNQDPYLDVILSNKEYISLIKRNRNLKNE
jgi:class 3 adenylate cyclase/tetratricopeptide (TPR) repeat protein